MKKLLIANRSEIATRIIRSARELGLETVAIFAKEDELSLHRFKASEAYQVGAGKKPIEAYLDIEDIIRVAKEHGVDAIHPGYGFLSENADFAQAAQAAGIKFVGPKVEHLAMFGDKIKAKQAAIAADVPTIPGTEGPVDTVEEALAFADNFGYPIFVKSAAGGGGKGMRVVQSHDELAEAFTRSASEAKASFGKSDVYLEKYLKDPKHVEIQIIADEHGEVMHLFERDSSVQRRHQKIIEFAPAIGTPEPLRQKIQQAAVKLMQSVGYQNAATVEFLVDGDEFYFVEVNPRVQVEHTVTEVVTGVDIVQTQLLVAQGERLHDARINLPAQMDLEANGVAIQARITSEDPENNFMPDTGRIQQYRSPGGTGVRLDGGNAFTGAVVSPYFDSLLVKAIVSAPTFAQANTKMARALNEFVIRGVKTNIPFLKNVFAHPGFLSGQAATTFLDTTPELFEIKGETQNSTRLLDYIAETTVNGYPGVDRESFKNAYLETIKYDKDFPALPADLTTAKDILDRDGASAVSAWLQGQERILLTDTTMRDAHQSLFATRLRQHDKLAIAGKTQRALPQLFSSEVWGGATFDVAMRFLGEDPWQNLRELRAEMPRTLLQMLVRGSNAVGYQNYPDAVNKRFIEAAAANGIDVFRIFDALNWIEQLKLPIQYARETGKIAEAAMAYSGDILDPTRTKYTRDYYVNFAKELANMGANIIAIKDMSGLLKPKAAYDLVSALKDAVDLPIHLHTHDTTGNGIQTYAAAAAAGVDVVDVASSAFSGTTSQPSMGALYYALDGHSYQPDIDINNIEAIDDYWKQIRPYYAVFGAELHGAQTDIYRTEMPGGQYSNLQAQAIAVGLGDKWDAVKDMYREVNTLFGDIIKVTPTSKVVGDMALFMVQNGLTPADVLSRGEQIDFPDSVIEFFQGDLGQPVGGFPQELQKIILKGRDFITDRPGLHAPEVDWAEVAATVDEIVGRESTQEEQLAYLMYPAVFKDFIANQKKYGPVEKLETPVFFGGLREGQRTDIELKPGRTVIMQLRNISEPTPEGQRSLFVDVNGQTQEVVIQDVNAAIQTTSRQKAEPTNANHLGATMAGSVVSVLVKAGQSVKQGQPVIVTEAMKMETTIQAPFDATIKSVYVVDSEQIDAGDLLIELEA
ncbi:MAG TPA: pyruvate carboxylase [Lactobacillaceae bacterium]|jgi:pyruvate carboxylase